MVFAWSSNNAALEHLLFRLVRHSSSIFSASVGVTAPHALLTAVGSKLSFEIKIAPAPSKAHFQNQGEDACVVPEMYQCLRPVRVRLSRGLLQVHIVFVRFFVSASRV